MSVSCPGWGEEDYRNKKKKRKKKRTGYCEVENKSEDDGASEKEDFRDQDQGATGEWRGANVQLHQLKQKKLERQAWRGVVWQLLLYLSMTVPLVELQDKSNTYKSCFLFTFKHRNIHHTWQPSIEPEAIAALDQGCTDSYGFIYWKTKCVSCSLSSLVKVEMFDAIASFVPQLPSSFFTNSLTESFAWVKRERESKTIIYVTSLFLSLCERCFSPPWESTSRRGKRQKVQFEPAFNFFKAA